MGRKKIVQVQFSEGSVDVPENTLHYVVTNENSLVLFLHNGIALSIFRLSNMILLNRGKLVLIRLYEGV